MTVIVYKGVLVGLLIFCGLSFEDLGGPCIDLRCCISSVFSLFLPPMENLKSGSVSVVSFAILILKADDGQEVILTLSTSKICIIVNVLMSE